MKKELWKNSKNLLLYVLCLSMLNSNLIYAADSVKEDIQDVVETEEGSEAKNPVNPSIVVKNAVYNLGEVVEFEVSAENAVQFEVVIMKGGEEVERLLAENGIGSWKAAEAGEYEAYLSASNDYGHSDSAAVNFVVYGNNGRWIQDTKGWRYRFADGSYAKSSILNINGKMYSFGSNTYMETGWRLKSGKWYYFGNDGSMRKGWQQIGGCWYYLDSTGVMLKNWQVIDGKWYWFYDSGQMATGWRYSSGKWYYLQKSGSMKLGWEYIDGKWYYFNETGAMQTGWQVIDGGWYLLKSSGEMVTGWKYSYGKWYYLTGSGKMAIGWILVGNHWYYMDSQGAMQTGWKYIDGTWYCFENSGEMITGWKYSYGKWYYLTGSGKMAIGWIPVGNHWYYMDSQGAMQTGWKYIDGTWYCFENSGEMATGWKYSNGKWYYMDNSGMMAVGWRYVNGKWYYLDKSGAMVTGWLSLNNKWYYLQNDGSMAENWCVIGGQWYGFDPSGAWDPDKSMKNSFIGIDRMNIVAELQAHEHDSYYLGTRYYPLILPNGSKDACMHPNGSPGYNGYVGLNCTGFVAFVFKKCGGDLSQIDSMGRAGGYVNATSWLDYTKRTGKTYYVYASVSALLASGRAQKGDIIYCEPDWSKPGADCHIGFFWGDTPSSNVFWHQVGRNIISNIKAGTPQIRYYLIKTGS